MEQISGSSFSALTILGFLATLVALLVGGSLIIMFDMVLSVSIKIDGIKFYIRIYEFIRMYESTPFANPLLSV